MERIRRMTKRADILLLSQLLSQSITHALQQRFYFLFEHLVAPSRNEDVKTHKIIGRNMFTETDGIE